MKIQSIIEPASKNEKVCRIIPGCLYTYEDSPMILCATDAPAGTANFSAVLVYSEQIMYSVGHYSTNWTLLNLIPFEGSVKLKNID